ncbi:uncharacterized protein [Rutidosis leptorrhynchoides]|uniref:uncharacterized protein n=1 Tax=Rutidosis leptorrhynchoides TaxID=125765 RepID=UPI003A9A302C
MHKLRFISMVAYVSLTGRSSIVENFHQGILWILWFQMKIMDVMWLMFWIPLWKMTIPLLPQIRSSTFEDHKRHTSSLSEMKCICHTVVYVDTYFVLNEIANRVVCISGYDSQSSEATL